MTAQLEFHLGTADDVHHIQVDSFLAAARAVDSLLKQLDRSIPGGKFEWTYAHLGIGSGRATTVGHWLPSKTDEPLAMNSIEAEREVCHRFVSGLRVLESGPRMPDGYTPQALRAAKSFSDVLKKDVVQIQVVAPNIQEQVEVTSRTSIHVTEILHNRRVTVTSIVGVLQRISLASRSALFWIREPISQRLITCQFDRADKSMMESVRQGLGRRVIVDGDTAYTRDGELIQVTKVRSIDILDFRQSFDIDDLIGIGPNATREPFDYEEQSVG